MDRVPQTYAAWRAGGGTGARIVDPTLDFVNHSFKSVYTDLERRLGSAPTSMFYSETAPYDGFVERINFANNIAGPVEEALEKMLRTGTSILSTSYVNDECLFSLISLNRVLHDHFRGQHHPLPQWHDLARKIADLRHEISTNCRHESAIQKFINSVVSLCTAIRNSRDTLQREEERETQMLIQAARQDDRERIVRNRKTIARYLGFVVSVCVIIFFFCNFLYCESTRFLSPQQRIASNLPATSIEMFDEFQKKAQKDFTGSTRSLHLTDNEAFFPVVSTGADPMGFYSPARQEFFTLMDIRNHDAYTYSERAQSIFSLVSLTNVYKYRFDYFKTHESDKCLIPRQLKDVINDINKGQQFIRDVTILPFLADVCAEIRKINDKEQAFDENTLNKLLSQIKQSTDIKIKESKSYKALSTSLEPIWRRLIFSTNFETALRSAVQNKNTHHITELARSFIAKALKEIKEMANGQSVIVFQVSEDSKCSGSGDSMFSGKSDFLWTYANSIWDALLVEQLYNAKSWEDRAFLLSTMPRNPLGLVSSAIVFSGATLSTLLSGWKIAKKTSKLLYGGKGKKNK